MKYMSLIYSEESAWTEEERQACFDESMALCRELEEKGQFIAASPLESVSMATSIRIRDGRRSTIDGPFAETREQLGGFFLVEAEDLDAALKIAERIPSAKKGTVEIRPVHELEERATNYSRRSRQ
ncbi:MAG: YciI family protein [Bdellovibrionales bacterium]|nr:YciI family protein [Bdellovibrionales bacterium]